MPDKSCLHISTPVGRLQLQGRNGHLVAVVILAGRENPPGEIALPAIGDCGEPVLALAASQLAGYFSGERREFDLPLELSAVPPFTRKILETLRGVAYGETLTYGELAARAGAPRAARAVGQAMAVNPLPIVIPCHRVVAAGGKPGGYSGGGGLTTKGWLLSFERLRCEANLANFQEKTA